MKNEKIRDEHTPWIADKGKIKEIFRDINIFEKMVKIIENLGYDVYSDYLKGKYFRHTSEVFVAKQIKGRIFTNDFTIVTLEKRWSKSEQKRLLVMRICSTEFLDEAKAIAGVISEELNISFQIEYHILAKRRLKLSDSTIPSTDYQ